MTCRRIDLGNGDFIITCSRGRATTHPCRFCGQPSALQCDYALSGKKAGKTCDAHMCKACSTNQGKTAAGETIDYCPPHARMVAKQQVLCDKPSDL